MHYFGPFEIPEHIFSCLQIKAAWYSENTSSIPHFFTKRMWRSTPTTEYPLLYSMMKNDRYFNHQLYWTNTRLKEIVLGCQRYWFSGKNCLRKRLHGKGSMKFN